MNLGAINRTKEQYSLNSLNIHSTEVKGAGIGTGNGNAEVVPKPWGHPVLNAPGK